MNKKILQYEGSLKEIKTWTTLADATFKIAIYRSEAIPADGYGAYRSCIPN